MRPEQLHRLAVLAEIVEAGGIAAAARRLGLAKSSVSHQVAALERETGVRVLDRRGRGVVTTAVGAVLAAHGRAILAEGRAALDAAREAEQPRGTLRISMPAGIADALLLPMLAAFLRAYPGIALRVVATDTVLDIARERIDLAFRIGGVEDGPFIARRLHEGRDVFVASPAYLTAAGPIRTPAELARHPFIGFAAFGEAPTMEVTGPAEERIEVRLSCRVTTTSGLAIRGWVLAGAGIARLPDFVVAEDIAAGRLVRLLPDHEAGRPTLYAAYLPERFRPANLRRLLDFAQRHYQPP